MKKRLKAFFCILLAILTLVSTSFAHSGKTDSKGGHKDNKNKSGLGSYHYHCSGHPPHLHPNGICPYSTEYKKQQSEVKTTSKQQTTTIQQKASTTNTGQKELENVKAALLTLIDKRNPTSTDINLLQTLLSSENLPFELTYDIFESEKTLFGKTNVIGLNLRKKEAVNSESICMVSLKDTVLVILEVRSAGWFKVMVYEDSKTHIGYVKSDMIDIIEKTDYFAGLYRILSKK